MELSETHLVVNGQLAIPLTEFHFAYVRSSGPGGQNVNKVNSQAQLSWNVVDSPSLPPDIRERLQSGQRRRISKAGLLRVDSQRYRDRERNRADCLNRVGMMLVQAAEPPVHRKLTKTPRKVHLNRLKNKQQRSGVKQSRRPPRQDD